MVTYVAFGWFNKRKWVRLKIHRMNNCKILESCADNISASWNTFVITEWQWNLSIPDVKSVYKKHERTCISTYRPFLLVTASSRIYDKIACCRVRYIRSQVPSLQMYSLDTWKIYGHKNIVDPGWPQMTVWRMRIACWIPKATKHTLRICNTYCFSATVVAQTRLGITFIHILRACYISIYHPVMPVCFSTFV
jgi:hypothetical protein